MLGIAQYLNSTKECQLYLEILSDTERAISKMGDQSENLLKVSVPLRRVGRTMKKSRLDILTSVWRVGTRKRLLPTSR